MNLQSYANQPILAIGAHPDDIEFGCGGTMALLSKTGAQLHFVVATDGNRGSRHHQVEKDQLVANRRQEAQQAAEILGAKEVGYMDQEDGNLIADLAFKEKVVRIIRQVKPQAIFTHDPTWHYRINEGGTAWVNHTDHRACGAAVLDAVYPLARDLQSFPEHISQGLEPHTAPELFLYGNHQDANLHVDITETIQTKIDSINAHVSQIDDPQGLAERIRQMHATLAEGRQMKYAESFVHLTFE